MNANQILNAILQAEGQIRESKIIDEAKKPVFLAEFIILLIRRRLMI